MEKQVNQASWTSAGNELEIGGIPSLPPVSVCVQHPHGKIQSTLVNLGFALDSADSKVKMSIILVRWMRLIKRGNRHSPKG